MKTLLLCGYRAGDNAENPIGVERDIDGQTVIDRRILQLRELGHDIIAVLAGATADEQLRQCRLIQTTELAFDISEPAGTLLSNTQAGALATNGEGFYVLPAEIPVPSPAIWNFLLNEYGKLGFATNECLLQAVTPQGAPWQFGFPLLVTRNGNKLLRNTPELKSLVDARLKSLQLEFKPHAELEPVSKPL